MDPSGLTPIWRERVVRSLTRFLVQYHLGPHVTARAVYARFKDVAEDEVAFKEWIEAFIEDLHAVREDDAV